MKAYLVLVAGVLGMLTGCCSVNDSYINTNYGWTCCNPCSIQTTCDCADPTCRCAFGNPCLERSRCCADFGNIGSSHFTPLTMNNNHHTTYQYAYVFRGNHLRSCYKAGC